MPAIVVVAIPTAFVESGPVYVYESSSPVTKKFSGILTLFVDIFTIFESLPRKYLSKIDLCLYVKLNAFLTSISVPSYSPPPALIEALFNGISDGRVKL